MQGVQTMTDGKSETTASEPRSQVHQRRLDDELRRRLWHLFDVAKAVSERGDSMTADEWAEFHLAVSRVPESQHGR